MLNKLFSKLINRRADKASPSDLIFTDNEAAFFYACIYLDCSLKKNAPLIALVMPGPNGTDPVCTESGIQRMILRVSSNDGGFMVVAETSGPRGPKLNIGDLVSWIPLTYIESMCQEDTDSRFAWCGLVTGKLKPILSPSGWVGEKRFGV